MSAVNMLDWERKVDVGRVGERNLAEVGIQSAAAEMKVLVQEVERRAVVG